MAELECVLQTMTGKWQDAIPEEKSGRSVGGGGEKEKSWNPEAYRGSP